MTKTRIWTSQRRRTQHERLCNYRLLIRAYHLQMWVTLFLTARTLIWLIDDKLLVLLVCFCMLLGIRTERKRCAMVGLWHIPWRCCIPPSLQCASEWKEASSLAPLSKERYLSSCSTSFGCHHIAIYWHLWPSTDRQVPLRCPSTPYRNVVHVRTSTNHISYRPTNQSHSFRLRLRLLISLLPVLGDAWPIA